jgi:S1-C subfamily serine protease
MRRSSPLVLVALAAAVLGASLALLGAKATGLLDGATKTVYVPRDVRELGSGPNEPVSASARPLVGNGFDPARIYAARSTGVVTVFAFFDRGDPHGAQGSGFVVTESGYILTSAHVITDAGTEASRVFIVFQDLDRARAEIVGWDVYDDVALLHVEPGAHALVPVPLGDSSRVHAGDPVAAMGSPFGKEDSIAVGVVSAVRRSISSLTPDFRVVDAIQIDAPITHGNSGGPLFDARGRVIGINAQISTDSGTAEGVGFAVPINAAERSMRQLAAIGHVVYAYLGVTTETLTPTLARHLGYETTRGAILSAVRDGGPADRAGLRGGSGEETFNGETISRGGDLIVAIDGEPVRSADDVVRQVAARLPGELTALTIVRGGDRRVVQVRLGSRPVAPETSR